LIDNKRVFDLNGDRRDFSRAGVDFDIFGEIYFKTIIINISFNDEIPMNKPLFTFMVHIEVENKLVHKNNVVVGLRDEEGVKIDIIVEIFALFELLKNNDGLGLMQIIEFELLIKRVEGSRGSNSLIVR